MIDPRHLWLENNLDIDKILEILENCDKDCKTCDRTDKNDCLLEQRESLHSLAIMFKKLVQSLIHVLDTSMREEPKEKYYPGTMVT